MARKPDDGVTRPRPRRSGHPPLTPDEPSVVVGVRIPKSRRVELQAEADSRGVPLSDVIRERLGLEWIDDCPLDE